MARTRHRDGSTVLWTLLGVVIAAVVAVAVYAYLGTFLFALFLYYATRPLSRWLNERIAHTDIAVTLTILAIVLPMLAVLGYASVLALQELDQFLATHSLDAYRSYLQPYLSLAREGNLQQLWAALTTDPGRPFAAVTGETLRGVFGNVATVAGFVFTVLSRLFLMVVFLYYFLRDDRTLRAWFDETVGHDDRVVSFATDVDTDLETVFFGNLAVVAVSGTTATASYVALNAVGGTVVSIPVLLGVLIGLGTLVPIVGMKLVYVPYGAYLLGLAAATDTPFWHPVAFLVVTFVVVDTIPDFFVRSYLSSRSGVHMGLVLLGYVLGVMAFGWMGLFLGPLVVVFLTHFAHSILPWLVREYDLN